MTARPILFSAPMVQALLAGRKTQTRRIIKPQPPHSSPFWKWMGAPMPGHSMAARCPYGTAGDLLWVREAFREDSPDDPQGAVYRADEPTSLPPGFRWKPGIHMPRWASRLTLRLTDVRVERVQSISETDVIAEGVKRTADPDGWEDARPGYNASVWRPPFFANAYGTLWDKINGDGSFKSNPWVWALTFEVLRQNVDAVPQEKTT